MAVAGAGDHGLRRGFAGDPELVLPASQRRTWSVYPSACHADPYGEVSVVLNNMPKYADDCPEGCQTAVVMTQPIHSAAPVLCDPGHMHALPPLLRKQDSGGRPAFVAGLTTRTAP